MEPTPPPINPVNVLMADIAIITQYVRAYNKRPLPATADEVKGLVKLAERDRPLVVKVTTEAVVEQIMGKTGESVAKFQSLYNQFLLLLEAQAKALKQDLATQATAMQTAAKAGAAAAVAMQTSADAVAAAGKKVKEDLPTSVPVRGEVYGFTDWKTAVGCLLGPVVLLLLGMAVTGQFSKVSKSDFEQLQKQLQQSQQQQQQSQAAQQKAEAQEELTNSAQKYFFAQIKKYKAKNPNTKDFPAYKGAE